MYEFLEFRVEDVMTASPVTLAPERTLAEAEALFEQHDFNGLPVVDPDGRLLGLCTKLDLLKAFRFTEQHVFPPYAEIMQRPVSEVMTRDVLTLTPRTPLTRVVQKLLDTRCKSFPVLDGDLLVGMVAREDVLRGLRQAVAGERPWREGEGPAGR
jgi:CBS domain-containing protein